MATQTTVVGGMGGLERWECGTFTSLELARAAVRFEELGRDVESDYAPLNGALLCHWAYGVEFRHAVRRYEQLLRRGAGLASLGRLNAFYLREGHDAEWLLGAQTVAAVTAGVV